MGTFKQLVKHIYFEDMTDVRSGISHKGGCVLTGCG